WGQVLNAVIPAGAREKAGTKAAAYLEAVPETDVPQPPPKLSPKQTAALEHLRSAGRALEARQLARLAKCGPAPLEALVEKGYARRVVKRVDRFADTSEEAQVSDEPITLNGDQEGVWAPVEEALRRDGFRAFLLHGVTGSGKTEIYLRAIEEVLRQGKE